jgi:hypothetical protein
MPRRRAGTSNPRRAGLRAAVAGGVPTARELAADHSGGMASRGFGRGSFENALTRAKRHTDTNLSLRTALSGCECISHCGGPSCFRGKCPDHDQAGGCR